MEKNAPAGSEQAPVKNKHGYGTMRLEDLKSEAQKPDSQSRSLNRRKEMTRAQKNLLARLGETDHLWYALRKHGSVEQCEMWLQKMALNSTWKTKRQQEDEILRKEYLQLWKECRHFEPDFVDKTMQERQKKAGVKTYAVVV